MIVNILSPTHCYVLAGAIHQHGDTPIIRPDPVVARPGEWLVTMGYRRLLSPEIVDSYEGRTVNLHISYLPHNRGADPNFWSWVDNTPKGVTLHQLDHGMDTGPIWFQKIVGLEAKESLRQSYGQLIFSVIDLFREKWPVISKGAKPTPQKGGGPARKRKDLLDRCGGLPDWEAVTGNSLMA